MSIMNYNCWISVCLVKVEGEGIIWFWLIDIECIDVEFM